jgi:hypothetical protein
MLYVNFGREYLERACSLRLTWVTQAFLGQQ